MLLFVTRNLLPGCRLEVLSTDALRTMTENARILEKDQRGPKVYKLSDGTILKFFWVKRRLSSASLIPYSRRFCANAARLLDQGIPTVDVVASYKLPKPGMTAVLYRPLEGETVREFARRKGLDKELLQKLGTFVSVLHQKGIYFRSLHLGNIVCMPDGGLGLIDVSDLKIFPRSLSCFRRIRNFKHLYRVKEDRKHFGETGWQVFFETYVYSAHVSQRCFKLLMPLLKRVDFST